MVVCNPLLQADCEGPYPHLLRRLLRHTDVCAPDFIGSCHHTVTKQVGIDHMRPVRYRRSRLLIHLSYTHDSHQGSDPSSRDRYTLPVRLILNTSRSHVGVGHVQLIDTLHQIKLGCRRRRAQSVKAGTREPQKLALAHNAQWALTVNHRLALSNPTLLSAPSKKSRSKVSYPILACKSFNSSPETPAALGALYLSKSSAICSSAYWRNWMIWFGCSANCSANSARVLSPFKAAIATLARNSGEIVLLGRLVLLGALRLHEQRPIINYRPVSKSRYGSLQCGRNPPALGRHPTVV
jgi:hypothetical protein